jgi:predicted PurR-regulated permease PerM
MTPHLGRRRPQPAPGGAPAASGDPAAPGADPAEPARPAGERTDGSTRPRRIRISLDQREIQAATIRVLVIVSIWLVAAWVVGVVQHFLFLILLAWLAAIALEPAIRWFLRRGVRRSRATAAVAVPVVLVVVGLVVGFEQMLFDQAAQLVQSAPATVSSIVDQLNSTFGLQLDSSQILVTLKLEPDQIQGVANDLALGALGWLGSLVAVVFDLVTVAVFTFYIAAAGPRLIQEVAVWLPPDRQPILGEIWDIAEQKTGGYVASKVVLAALSAFFHGVFFWVIGLPGWLPLALLAGITAQFVPVIGTYIGVAAPVVVALADRPITAVWIVLFAIVYQQIETYVLTPRISRRTMEVNPAIALAAVFIGAAIWGPIGAIIGVPIAAVAVSVIQTYGRRYELVPHLAGVHGRDDAVPDGSASPEPAPDSRTEPDSPPEPDPRPEPAPKPADGSGNP